MSTVIRAGAAMLLVATAVMAQSPSLADWERADAATVRLAPEKINALPPPVRQELTRLGCTIPQVWGSAQPNNFITGRFSSPSRTDVAVLCSRNRISSILVFSTGSTQPIAEFAEEPDKGYLQVVEGNGRIGFSRALLLANPQAIRTYHANSGGSELLLLDHDGIDDAVVEKGSRVWYWHEGSWLQLMGSD